MAMKVVILLLLFSTLVAAFELPWPWPFDPKPKTPSENMDSDAIEQKEWEEYMKSYEKNYNATESARRFELYKKRKAEIDAHNELYKQGKTSYMEGLNQFSDYTDEELNNMRGSLVKPMPANFSYP